MLHQSSEVVCYRCVGLVYVPQVEVVADGDDREGLDAMSAQRHHQHKVGHGTAPTVSKGIKRSLEACRANSRMAVVFLVDDVSTEGLPCHIVLK